MTLGDETMTLVEWGEKTGISANTIWTRIAYGWSVEKALTVPSVPGQKIHPKNTFKK